MTSREVSSSGRRERKKNVYEQNTRKAYEVWRYNEERRK